MVQLKFWVMDESRVPVNAATAEVYTASNSTPGGAAETSASSNADGMVTFTGLAASTGARDVKVDKGGKGFWLKGLGEWILTRLYLGVGLILLDQGSDPAAPGASENIIYTKAGVLYQRSGAAGTVGGLVAASVNVPQGTGTIGIGGGTDRSVSVSGQLTTGVVQYGMIVGPVISTTATTSAYAIYAQVQTPNSSFTTGEIDTIRVLTPNKGAAHTITNAVGIAVDAVTSGTTANYGIQIGAPSGATTNVGLQNAGITRLLSGCSISGVDGNNTLTASGDGNTSAHNALVVQNGVGNPLITARNDGLVTIGTSPTNSIVNIGASSTTLAFFGAAGSTIQALGSASTDLTTVIQLANNIRTALRAYNLCN